MNNELFNIKRKILKKKFDLKNQIDSLVREQNALSSKGDLSAALKLNDKKTQLMNEMDFVNKELSEFNNLKEFNYIQKDFFDLSIEEKSTFLYFKKDDSIPINSDINHIFSSLTEDSSKPLSIGKSLEKSLTVSQIKSLINNLTYSISFI